MNNASTRAVLHQLLAALWWRGSWMLCALGLLAAAAGVAVWVAVDRFGDLAVQVLERGAAGGALPSVVVSARGGLDAARLHGLGDPVRAVLPRQFGTVRLQRGERQCAVQLLGADLAKEVMARPMRFGRRDGTAHGGDALVFVDEGIAAALAAGPGDRLVVHGEGGAVEVTFGAVLGSLGDGLSTSGVAIVELSTSMQVLGRALFDQAELLLEPDQDPEAFAARIGNRLGDDVTATTAASRRLVTGSAAALRTTWRLAGLLALAFAAIALFAVLIDQVRARGTDLALLRALGAPPGLLRTLVVVPATGIGLLAAVLGGLLGPPLAEALRPGLQACLELQTGAGVWLEPGALSIRQWAVLLAAGAGLAAVCALAIARADRQRGFAEADELMRTDGASRAFATARLVAAGAAFVFVYLLSSSGLLERSAALRAVDLVVGIAAVALAAPPLAAVFARRSRTSGAVSLLAAQRLRQRPGSLLGGLRVLATALAIVVALLAMHTSLARAVPAWIANQVQGDLVVTTLPQLLSLPTTAEPFVVEARAATGIQRVEPGVGATHVWIEPGIEPRTVGNTLLAGLPPGAVVLAAAPLRQRLVAVAELAIGTLHTMVVVLLLLGLTAALAFFWLDAVRSGSDASLLRALGASPAQRRQVRLRLGLWFGVAAATVGCLGGLLLGHAWTRGPLRLVSGWDCDYVVPWSSCLLLVAATPLATAAMAALATFVRPRAPAG